MCIETDTFRANRLTLGEYGLEDRVLEINRAAAAPGPPPGGRIFHARASRASSPARSDPPASCPPRTTRSFPTSPSTSWRTSSASRRLGLIQGGVDLLLIETSQDILEVKAAITGIHQAFAETGIYLPIQAQVTLDTTGRMLLGTDIAAALTILEGLPIDVIGLNCSTGPEHMREPIRYPGRERHPAGLVHPQRRAAAQRGRRGGLPAGAGAVRRGAGRIRREEPHQRGGRLLRHHPGPPASCWSRSWATRRSAGPSAAPAGDVPRLASATRAMPMHQEPPPLLIGERCNAQGSRKFKRLLLAEDYDAILEIGPRAGGRRRARPGYLRGGDRARRRSRADAPGGQEAGARAWMCRW